MRYAWSKLTGFFVNVLLSVALIRQREPGNRRKQWRLAMGNWAAFAIGVSTLLLIQMFVFH